jgi:hypothetical protein
LKNFSRNKHLNIRNSNNYMYRLSPNNTLSRLRSAKVGKLHFSFPDNQPIQRTKSPRFLTADCKGITFFVPHNIQPIFIRTYYAPHSISITLLLCARPATRQNPLNLIKSAHSDRYYYRVRLRFRGELFDPIRYLPAIPIGICKKQSIALNVWARYSSNNSLERLLSHEY